MADNISKTLYSITNALNLTVSAFRETQNAANIDTGALDGVQEHINQATEATNQLNSNIESTQKYIKNNGNEQEKFNGLLGKGQSASGGLLGNITKMAAAYASIQGMKKVLDLSDTTTQTEARLSLIVDDGGSVDELQNKIFKSAQRARADYQLTSDVISKLGTQASSAFADNDEMIDFAEQLNKTFKIAGTQSQAVDSVMYNLTQALSSGVLRGQDLNSVFSNTPQIVQNIADYMDVPIGQIRKLAEEGKLSAEVVKNAMFYMADETNEKFENIPRTFGDAMTGFKNDALMAFQPVLDKLSEFANSQAFQDFVAKATTAISAVADAVMWLFELASTIGSYFAENWGTIGPLVYGIVGAILAWQAAQAILNLVMNANPIVLFSVVLLTLVTLFPQLRTGILIAAAAFGVFNAVLNSNPLFLIITLVALVIMKIIEWANAVGGFRVLWLIVLNAIKTAWDWVVIALTTGVYWVIDAFNNMKLKFVTVAVAIQNFMGDMKAGVLMILQNLINGAIGLINKFIGALNLIPGVSIDMIGEVTFGTEAQLKNEAEKQAREAGLEAYKEEIEAGIAERAGKLEAMKEDARASTAERLAEIENAKAAANQKNEATDISDPADNTTSRDIAQINANTSDLKGFAEEDLKYLRDIAERDTINRFTTASVSVEMKADINATNNNDLDGIVDYLTEEIEIAMYTLPQGV